MYRIIGADGNQYGPASLIELQGWIRERRANGDTLAQGPGMTDWKPLREFPEFAQVLQEVAAPSMAAPYAATPAVNVSEMVAGPATALAVLGALIMVANLFALVSHLLGLNTPMMDSTGDPQLDRILKMMAGTAGLISYLLGLGFGGLSVIAGLQMRKLKNHGFAMTMMILNMLPCCNSCCCLLGLPIGIWGLVVLMKPEVKSAFLK